MSEHFPIVVVGGGPAGATAAEHLARARKKVLIIEKSGVHPFREKPCGGGLGPLTIKMFPYTKRLGIHKTERVVLTMGGETTESKVSIVMVHRNKFDRHLLDRAIRTKAKVLFGHSVKEVDIDKQRLVLDNKLALTYDYLIGAAGVTCPVARALGLRVKTVPLLVGKADGGKKLNRAEAAEIIFFDDFKGYAWVFPKKDFLDIGIGGSAPVEKLKKLLATFLDERNLEIYDQTGWHLPFTVPTSPLHIAPRTILCGDAGGLVNPATGEGIRYAMQSGMEAAQVILRERVPDEYPSFLENLIRLQKAREKVFEIGVKKHFHEMKNAPDVLEQTIDFYFRDAPPPKHKPMTDQEKVETLRKLTDAISDEEVSSEETPSEEAEDK